MENILVVCGAGASSTFLASRMRALANARGLTVDVRAASSDNLSNRLPGIDALLVGPHLSATFDSIRSVASEFGVVAALLPADVFGPTGAEEALAIATELLPGLSTAASTEGTPHA